VDDVDEEIRAHFEGTVDLLVGRGWSPDAAEAEARRRFGSVGLYRKRMKRIHRGRRRRGMTREWTSGIRSGLAFALRSVRRSPGFVAVVVLLLALGLGANATMFTVVDRLLLSAPSHVREPDRLRQLFIERKDRNGEPSTTGAFTWADVRDLEALPVFSGVAAWAGGQTLTLGDGEDTERVNVTIASWRLFDMLGVRAARGRFFGPEEDRAGAPGTAVLSHELWVRRFGADPDVIGRSLHLGNGRYEVIGIAPEGFTGAELWPVEAWLPLFPGGLAEMGEDWPEARGWWWLEAAVRMAPDATDEVAEARATAAHRAGRSEVEGYDPEARIELASIIRARGPNASAEAAISRWLAGVSLVVLLIACANVANLLLARSVRLSRELAVRMALGSSRSRLVAHFLTESLTLALLAGACAVAVSLLSTEALQRLLLPDVAFGSLVGARLLAFVAVAAALTALAAGALPAIVASRPDVRAALSASGTRAAAAGGGRLRRVLVVAQTALSTVLLVGAALFVSSLRRAEAVDLGFQPEGALLVRVERGDPDPEASAEADVSIADIYAQMEESLPRVAGVEAAARTVAVPMGLSYRLPVVVPEMDSVPRLPSGRPNIGSAAPGYFALVGQPVLQGREFEVADLGEGAEPVAVINQVLAEHAWPDADPLTRCLHVGGPSRPCSRVVGVVANTPRRPGDDPRMMVWHPLNQGPLRGVRGVMVRTAGPPAEHLDRIRAAIHTRWPSVRYVEAQLMTEPLARELRSWRLGASLFGVFGLLAALVAGIGVYSLLAFDVAQRRHELGIRMALGAAAGRLVGSVLASGTLLALLGIALGLAAAAVAAPGLQDLLFETRARQPEAFLAAGVSLLAVAVVASWLPAVRATRVDPGAALRAD
jgi:predicted permease